MAKVLVQYEADTSQLQTKLKAVEQSNSKVEASSKSAGKSTTDAYKSASKAAEDATQKNNSFHKSLESTSGVASGFSNIFEQIALGIGAAFAVDKVLRFAEVSIKAFASHQAAAEKLRFAIDAISGEEGAYDRLVKQSEKLEKSLKIFDGDDIQGIQAAQVEFGLTANQIEKLTPLILDLATVQKVDLSTATDTALRAITGQTRALKTVGAAFKDTGSATENYNILVDNLAKLSGSAANALNTVEGQLKADEVAMEALQETIGERLAPALLALKKGTLEAAEAFTSMFFALDPKSEALQRIENLKAIFKDDSTNTIKDKIADIQKELENIYLAPNRIDALNARLAAARLVILERAEEDKRATQDAIRNAELEGLAKENLIELNRQQLSEEIAALKLRKDSNSKDIQDQIERREQAIEELIKKEKILSEKLAEQRQANSDKLAEQTLKDQQDAKSASQEDVIGKLRQDQKNAEDNARMLFEQGKKTKQDAENLAADLIAIQQKYGAAIEKETIDQATKLQEQQQKIRAENIRDIQDAIDKDTQAVVNGYKEQYIKVGDLSEQAQEQLNDKIAQAKLSGLQLQLAEAKVAGENTVELESTINDLIINQNETKNKRIIKSDEEAANERERILQEIGDTAKQLYTEVFNFTSAQRDAEIQQIEDNKNAQLDAFDEQLDALEKANERGIYSDRVYEQKKKELLDQRLAAEKKNDRELRKLKREQAEQDKLKAIFDIIVNTSVAVSKLLATPFLAVAAGIAGALQLATVIATPIPKFFKGVSYVERGNNPRGRDTIPAMLDEGERVFSAEKNRKNWDVLEAIENNNFKKFIEKNYQIPLLRKYKEEQENEKQKSFAGNIAASLITSGGLTFYDADRLRKKGMTINNTKELAELIGEVVADKFPKNYGTW